jgi:hydrogenase maturation protease
LKKILIYGYGNPGRQDDGLGIMLVERLEQWSLTNQINYVFFDANYQLNIEDALTISKYDMVIFVDASVEEIESVQLTRVVASQKTEFTMHAMAPAFILHLCQTLYGKFPYTYLLHIKGYEFDFLGDISQSAEKNLAEGIDLLKRFINNSNNPFELIERYLGLKKETKTSLS